MHIIGSKENLIHCSVCKGLVEIDEQEFKTLFELERQINMFPVRTKGVIPESVVKVIDSNRANNGGIILARLKMSYEDIARAIEAMDESNFNVEQIKGIMEYIPSEEESISLQRHTSCIKSIEQGQLCECEKFMCAMV